MVGGTNKGDLIVWHVATGQVVTEKKGVSEHPLTSVDWNPTKRDEVAFIDKNGHWSVVKTQTALAGPPESEPVKDKAKAKQQQSSKNDHDEMNEDELAAALFDDDEDEDENSFSIRKIKKETGFLNEDEPSRDGLESVVSEATTTNEGGGSKKQVWPLTQFFSVSFV